MNIPLLSFYFFAFFLTPPPLAASTLLAFDVIYPLDLRLDFLSHSLSATADDLFFSFFR